MAVAARRVGKALRSVIWLRTNGVNTKSMSTGGTQQVPVKTHESCSDPIGADPIRPFPSCSEDFARDTCLRGLRAGKARMQFNQ